MDCMIYYTTKMTGWTPKWSGTREVLWECTRLSGSILRSAFTHWILCYERVNEKYADECSVQILNWKLIQTTGFSFLTTAGRSRSRVFENVETRELDFV